jgi:hypothetical protein
MPWTEAIEEILDDGEWHDVNDVIAAGAELVPDDRAIAVMEKHSRATQADPARRIAAGKKTLSRQALMGQRRFGKAEFSPDKKRVRKASPESISPGVLAERVATLEAQMIQVLAALNLGDAPSAEEIDNAFAGNGVVTSESETAEILSDPETMAAIAEGQVDRP